MSNENKEIKVKLGKRVKGKIELQQIDLTPYVGKKVKIIEVGEYEGQYGFYIKPVTEIVDTIKREGKDDIVLQPSKLLGLHEDDEGNLGWNDKTELGLYLKKHKVEHYNDLVGLEVVVQIRTTKKGTEFLDFN